MVQPYVTQFHRVMKDGASCILFLDRKYTGLITYLIEQEFDLNFKNKVYFKRSIRPWYHKIKLPLKHRRMSVVHQG